MTPRAVVVAHRQAMVAEGIAAALGDYPGIVPVGVATSAAEAERSAALAEAAALDEDLPGATSAAWRLRKRGVRVVMLGVVGRSDDDDGIVVSTDARIAALAEALVPGTPAVPPSVAVLTGRERQILELVAEGMAGKQVARHLGISAKTVERHKTRMYSKLGVSNQAAAVSAVFGRGSGREGAWSRSSI
ncbi:MAG: response regulator transcription factor [Actinomycetota bacterium]